MDRGEEVRRSNGTVADYFFQNSMVVGYSLSYKFKIRTVNPKGVLELLRSLREAWKNSFLRSRTIP
jgi:hypothetical protein